MKPDEYTEDKPKNHFEWGYLYKVYLVILIAVFLLALVNQAHAGVFLEINSQMEYYDSQIQMSDVIYNADVWDGVANYMNDVHGVPFPSYSEATAMDDLLENVLMYYVGQYCNLSGTAAQQVYDTCTDIADTASQVWDYISLDLESGDFIATPNHEGDLSNVIHGVVDPLIYSQSDGYWYQMPCTYVRDSYSYACTSSGGTVYLGFYSTGSTSLYPIFVTVDSGCSVTRKTYLDGSLNGTNSWNITTPYTGSKISGYCKYGSLGSVTKSTTINGDLVFYFTSSSAALTDFFGDSPSMGESYLNGEGYIINENPTYPPLSGYSGLNYPYRTKIVENHTNTTDPDDPVEYPEGVNDVEPASKYKDVPTWLVDPTVDIPEEPDYLENVDVELPEIEPDTGFITDCYNALPSGIVSMIAVGLGLGVVIKIIS